MSVAYTEHPEEGYVEVVIDGNVSSRDMAEIVARMEAFATAAGQVSVLQTIRRLGFVNPLAALPHAPASLRMLGRVRRVAVVTDNAAIGPLTRLSGVFSPVETRQFRATEDAAARAWLSGPDAPEGAQPSA